MSIINCPQCGKMVSDQADQCPHCNCRVRETLAEKEKLCNRQIYKNHIAYIKSAISAIDAKIAGIANLIDLDIANHENEIIAGFESKHIGLSFEQFLALETAQYIDLCFSYTMIHPLSSESISDAIRISFSTRGIASIVMHPDFTDIINNALGINRKKAYSTYLGNSSYRKSEYETDFITAIELMKRLRESKYIVSIVQKNLGELLNDRDRTDCRECRWHSVESVNVCPNCGYPIREKQLERYYHIRNQKKIDFRSLRSTPFIFQKDGLYKAKVEIEKLRFAFLDFLSCVKDEKQYEQFEQYLGKEFYVGYNKIGTIHISFFYSGYARLYCSADYYWLRDEIGQTYACQKNIAEKCDRVDGDYEYYYDFFLPISDAIQLINTFCTSHSDPYSGKPCKMEVQETRNIGFHANKNIGKKESSTDIEEYACSIVSIFNEASLDPIKSIIEDDRKISDLFF